MGGLSGTQDVKSGFFSGQLGFICLQLIITVVIIILWLSLWYFYHRMRGGKQVSIELILSKQDIRPVSGQPSHHSTSKRDAINTTVTKSQSKPNARLKSNVEKSDGLKSIKDKPVIASKDNHPKDDHNKKSAVVAKDGITSSLNPNIDDKSVKGNDSRNDREIGEKSTSVKIQKTSAKNRPNGVGGSDVSSGTDRHSAKH